MSASDEIRAIERLKARYLRLLDQKKLDEPQQLLTECQRRFKSDPLWGRTPR